MALISLETLEIVGDTGNVPEDSSTIRSESISRLGPVTTRFNEATLANGDSRKTFYFNIFVGNSVLRGKDFDKKADADAAHALILAQM